MDSDPQKLPATSATANYRAGCGPESPSPDAGEEPAGTEHPAAKILIIDDDKDLLETYRKLLSALPSRPEIHTANSASRGFALLDSESFALLITDLRMPKIDGFQVLMNVRRKYPDLRTVVLTALDDEQYRVRAYGMGIDLYAEKPITPGEFKLFSHCVESLLMRSTNGGFRGIQSKSLMDLVQQECLSQNSCVLRITNGALEARIWIHHGDVIDALTREAEGEEAFRSVFEWKSGNFEILPGDASRPRAIFTSFQALLLDTAQAMDETLAVDRSDDGVPRPSAVLAPLSRVAGVESLLMTDAETGFDSWGVENAERFAEWTREVTGAFRELGRVLQAGPLKSIEALGERRHLAILTHKNNDLLAGLDRTLSSSQVREAVKALSARWEA